MAMAFAGASVAKAELIQWSIESSASKLTLAIPDAVLNLSGTLLTARVRNETGSSNTWNVGNSASMSGLINTDYKEVGQHNIQYLANPLGQWKALTSGNYRPNPAQYNPTSTDATNTNGTFTGSTAQNFPAVFAAKLRATAVLILPLTFDAAFMDIYNVMYDAISGVLPVSGLTGGSFVTNNLLTLGIADAPIALDGFGSSILGQAIPQAIPDTLDNLGSSLGLNTSLSNATITDLGGLNRRMTIPVLIKSSIDVGGFPLNITLTGTIVAVANVPEPATLMMAGVGIVGLSAVARRKYMKKRSA